MQCSVKHKWVESRNEYFIALQGTLKNIYKSPLWTIEKS